MTTLRRPVFAPAVLAEPHVERVVTRLRKALGEAP